MENQRKRAKAVKSTGGKAPRKMLGPKAARFDYRCAPSIRDLRKEDRKINKEAESREVQTYQSTSDVQTQYGNELKDKKTQTENSVSVTELQNIMEKQSRTIQSLEDELTRVYHRVSRVEDINRTLMIERTSLCNKNCCKDSA